MQSLLDKPSEDILITQLCREVALLSTLLLQTNDGAVLEPIFGPSTTESPESIIWPDVNASSLTALHHKPALP